MNPIDRMFRVDNAKPCGKEQLRAAIYAAGERCKQARAKGWIDEKTERLPDDAEGTEAEGDD